MDHIRCPFQLVFHRLIYSEHHQNAAKDLILSFEIRKLTTLTMFGQPDEMKPHLGFMVELR